MSARPANLWCASADKTVPSGHGQLFGASMPASVIDSEFDRDAGANERLDNNDSEVGLWIALKCSGKVRIHWETDGWS
jgi:hypothetical protein